jgi:ATP/maltotriose-dependent transcriptional regulator MalT
LRPRGYGKTTLLGDWLAHSSRPYAWLTLDEHDSNPAVFLSYLVAAVRTLFREACGTTSELLRAPVSMAARFAPPLSESACRSESIDEPRPDWTHLTRSG